MPIFTKVKEKLQQQVSAHNPDSVSFALDGWTAKHHGYIGIIAFYMHEWKRYVFHVYCQPFDESHTAASIRGSMEEHLTD